MPGDHSRLLKSSATRLNRWRAPLRSLQKNWRHVEKQLGTILNKGPIWGRLSRAYASLAFVPEHDDRSRSATLDQYGAYEVRLIELSQQILVDDRLIWLELFCHSTKSSLDSCRCDNLDDAEIAADHFVSTAKRLQGKSE
jgi:hypothetical protein